jgi:LPXTG-motif cell wall-anchored protein
VQPGEHLQRRRVQAGALTRPVLSTSTTGFTDVTITSGDLANTGSGSNLPLAGAAVAAVGIGAGAVLVARRRRAARG